MNLIKLYGERNTGTNCLSQLIRRNFEVSMLCQGEPRLMYKYLPDDSWPVNLYFKVQFPQHLGWERALVKPEKIALQARIPLDKFFVTLTKNLYLWLLSMYKRPYHAKAKAQSLEDFLASPWSTLQREDMPDAPDTSEALAMINARLNREVMTHYGYNVL